MASVSYVVLSVLLRISSFESPFPPMLRHVCVMTLFSSVVALPAAIANAGLWVADAGDGTYRNPVLHADYSDPDAIRVGGDYWMVSSSFGHVPGLPILHSRDLVNWSLVAHALPRLVPEEAFATPQHGKGVWAPALRYHDGKFWIYYPDPDFGLYLITATDPRGPWSAPVLVRAGKGMIDPCPLWDADGSVYLIHGWARSRAGISNVLTLLRLSTDGTRVEEDLGVVIDGHKLPGYSTLEGPKLYRRNGWYYVFAPAGGVKTGWQSVFRSRSIRGPFADRIVLAQGRTPINGPHQGALVDTPAGEEWFLHFQDKDAYGRIVHLQPVVWRDDWPVIGRDPEGDGQGEPVLTHPKPAISPRNGGHPSARSSSHNSESAESAGNGAQANASPAGGEHQPADSAAPGRASIPTSDEFDSAALGLQWQWQANPRADWHSLSDRPGFLRLFARPVASKNLFTAPHLLLQKFPAPTFTVTAKLDVGPSSAPDAAGLIVFGFDYAWLGRRDGQLVLIVTRKANSEPKVSESIAAESIAGPVFLRVTVAEGALCRFAYSWDGKTFTNIGAEFKATPSRWVGAKVGLFAAGENGEAAADFDWIRFAPAAP